MCSRTRQSKIALIERISLMRHLYFITDCNRLPDPVNAVPRAARTERRSSRWIARFASLTALCGNLKLGSLGSKPLLIATSSDEHPMRLLFTPLILMEKHLPRRAGMLFLSLLLFTATAVYAQSEEQINKEIEVLRHQSKARAHIVKRVSPSVVHIAVEKTVRDANSGGEGDSSPFDDEFFRKFFAPRLPHAPKQRGLGSGTIVDKRGYILTNNHVVEGAEKIIVKTKDGREMEATLLGADPATDLAVIQVKTSGLPVATLGNSDDLEVGETVMAIGNPFGLEQTVTQGIVSAKGRSAVGVTDYEDFIQTDASINPGNSGGPMVNLNGEIVGVNTAIFSRSGGNMGIGFSIPINMARQIMTELIDFGRVVRGYLGVEIQEIGPDLAQALGVKKNEGVLISRVGSGSPAGKSGIQRGDVVLRFNDKPVSTPNELRNVVASVKPGKKAPALILRNGKQITLSIDVDEQPGDMRTAIRGAEPGSPPAPGRPEAGDDTLGMHMETLTADRAGRLGYNGLKGVLITDVADEGPAADAGLRQGMLIVEANRTPVANVREFRKLVNATDSGQHLLLLVYMGDSSRYLGIKKP